MCFTIYNTSFTKLTTNLTFQENGADKPTEATPQEETPAEVKTEENQDAEMKEEVKEEKESEEKPEGEAG